MFAYALIILISFPSEQGAKSVIGLEINKKGKKVIRQVKLVTKFCPIEVDW